MASAQDVVRREAPPEIRTLFQELVTGANGDAAGWEAFAQAHYSPALLKKETPEQRAAIHKQINDRSGSIGLNGVRREGPDAPLQAMVKGSKAEGIIRIELDFDTPKIVSIAVEGGAANARAEAGGVPPPPVDGKMTSDEIDRRLNDYFTKLAADEVFSGVALVAKNGVPVFFKAYGFADREKKVANTIRTRSLRTVEITSTARSTRSNTCDGRIGFLSI